MVEEKEAPDGPSPRAPEKGIWTFRPAPHIRAMIEGLVASGEFRNRTQALNNLVAKALETYWVPEDDPGPMIQISPRMAIRLSSLFEQILGSLSEKVKKRLVEEEFRNLEERSQELLGEREALIKTISRREIQLKTTRSELFSSKLQSQIKRDQDRVAKVEKVLDRIDQAMITLRSQMASFQGDQGDE